MQDQKPALVHSAVFSRAVLQKPLNVKCPSELYLWCEKAKQNQKFNLVSGQKGDQLVPNWKVNLLSTKKYCSSEDK